MQTAIYLRHRGRVMAPPGDGAAALTYLATLLKNIEGRGWTCSHLRSDRHRAAHSGDIVTAPEGACEVYRPGHRLGGALLRALRGDGDQRLYRPLVCNLPECYAGWMLRKAPQSGEVFEPRTVQQKSDVAADMRICVPVILDLVERRAIWAGLALRRNLRWFNNVEGNQKGMLLMGQALTSLVKPDLFELFTLHAAARGTPSAREAADIVFAPDGDVTPFGSGVILADYL